MHRLPFSQICYSSQAWDDYQHSLAADAVSWDYILLTASDEAQAAGYRAQLASRGAAGLLPAQTHFAVLPDPRGKRVGSGGATLAALDYVAAHSGRGDFSSLRILLIHSGGDSKRAPQYSAIGKLFSPVPPALTGGRPSTLFDEWMIAAAFLAPHADAGMLVLSGDVLLLFDPKEVELSDSGATALSCKSPAAIGKNHGVFLCGADGSVCRFLHKQTEETLAAEGATDAHGEVDIDTGAIFFAPDLLASLYSLLTENGARSEARFARLVNENTRLSLYGDFLYPLATDATEEDYLREKPEGDFTPALLAARKEIFSLLRPYRMQVCRLFSARFLHFGTTAEARALMNADVDGDFAVYNSEVDPRATVGEGAYLENVRVTGSAAIGAEAVLSSLEISDETIPPRMAFHALRQRDGKWVVRLFGVSDNPKTDTFLGEPLAAFLEKNGLTPADLWSGEEHTLWTAALYPVCDTQKEALAAALNLAALARGEGDLAVWKNAARTGLFAYVEADPDCGLETADLGEKMRFYAWLGRVTGGEKGDAYYDACFRALQVHTLQEGGEPIVYREDSRIQGDTYIAELPLRVNFGGGWSDTPPYCNEKGGAVLNAAILLNGAKPVQVTLTRLDEPKIIFHSRDMDVHGEFAEIAPLQETGDPHDPFALQKAALIACGIIPAEGGELFEILDRLGGGFLMNSEVTDVPKGSGLGTSSILSAACVQALLGFVGVTPTADEVYRRVLCMEQIMATGGGWQDQVGGLTAGVKFITSLPGVRQDLSVEYLTLDEETKKALADRFALIYTGERRLGRTVLRKVMGNYLENDPAACAALEGIKRLAGEMRAALLAGETDSFAALLDEHLSLLRRIDGGCATPRIDEIFAVTEDLVAGRMICGAGGGGFLQVMLKKGITHADLAARLSATFTDKNVTVWPCSILFE